MAGETHEDQSRPQAPPGRFLPIALATGGSLFLGWLAGRYVYQRELATAAKKALDEHHDLRELPGVVW